MLSLLLVCRVSAPNTHNSGTSFSRASYPLNTSPFLWVNYLPKMPNNA